MAKTTKDKQKALSTFVGIKEFRRDFAKYTKQAQSGGQPVVVTKHNKPLFVLTPLSDEIYSDSLLQAVAQAQADVAAGRVYTVVEVRGELGL